MTRVAFDTNVIVSAALFDNSVPGQAVVRALRSGTILISGALVEELSAVLARDRFDRYVSREMRADFLDALVRESEVITVTEFIHVCRDPKDDHVLDLAVNGKAEVIVTGDNDLLVLNPFRGVRIVTPAEFLDG